jgi:hypothetical protein
VRHYLYRHTVIINDREVPFYIGIGTKSNHSHRSYKREFARAFDFKKRKSSWINFVGDKNVTVDILCETESYNEVKLKEIEFISLYGREITGEGTLVNITAGGAGSLGYSLPPESILKANILRKGRKLTEEHKAKISASNKGQRRSIECIEKVRLSHLGRKRSDETRRKMSIAQKGTEWTDERRQRVSKSMKEYYSINTHKPFSKETLLKMSIAKKGKPSNRAGVVLSNETRLKISTSLKLKNRQKNGE